MCPPGRAKVAQTPGRARVKFIYRSLHLGASYSRGSYPPPPPPVPWKDAKWPVPARVKDLGPTG